MEERSLEQLYEDFIQAGKRLHDAVKPTKEEIENLTEDLQINPHIYTESLEDDLGYIAACIYEEREAEKENDAEKQN